MKYFAFGSNMSEEQMLGRCPDAKVIGKAVLNDYKIAFTIFSPKRKCGCADVIKASGEEVWGVLYEISTEDLEKLDKAEAHPHKYRRFTVTVRCDEAGGVQTAEAYEVVKKEADFMQPSKHYLGLMQDAAFSYDFPESYQALLAKIPTTD